LHWETKGWRAPLIALKFALALALPFLCKIRELNASMEFQAVNSGYAQFPYRQDDRVPFRFAAWSKAMTGIPLIDACMRPLQATGYNEFSYAPPCSQFSMSST